MNASRLRVLSWNMNQSATSWSYLKDLAARHQIDVALLQEARLPATAPGVRCEPDSGDVDRWRLPVPVGLRRNYCSAVVCFNTALDFQPMSPVLLSEAEYGQFAASHPGQFAVATVSPADAPSVTLVSLYGIWDAMSDSGDIYAYASLHRAISDLTPVFQGRGARVLLAGDLNVWHGYGGRPWADRFQVVFERLASQGLELVGPFRATGQPPLEDCPCGPLPDCRHVSTFRYQRKSSNRPYQNDFVFATEQLSGAASVTAITEDEVWRHSDHVPIIAEFATIQEGQQ